MIDGGDISALTADTEYNMKFRSESMKNVIKSIARKFDVTISVTDKNLNNCHVSADFTDSSLESTLTILTEMLDINYTIKGSHVQLSGKGC